MQKIKPVSAPRLFMVVIIAAQLLGVTPASAQTRVTAQSLDQLKITVEQSVPANVVSLRETTIAAQITSTVVTLPRLVGDKIHADALISTLDCVDNQLQLERAKAEMAALEANQVLANRQLQRLNKLKTTNNASEQEVNQKQEELDVVQARIKAQDLAIQSAQRNVDKCQIRSPFPAVVTAIHSKVGSFVTPGQAIVSITDIQNVELSAGVSDGEIKQIRKAENLEFVYQQQRYPVSVRTVVAIVDAVSQNQHMRLVFDDDQPPPGAIGRLMWNLSGKIVPASLVVTRAGKSGVFVIDNRLNGDHAEFVVIEQARPGQPAAVDLPGDTLIVMDGRYSISNGDPVSTNSI